MTRDHTDCEASEKPAGESILEKHSSISFMSYDLSDLGSQIQVG